MHDWRDSQVFCQCVSSANQPFIFSSCQTHNIYMYTLVTRLLADHSVGDRSPGAANHPSSLQPRLPLTLGGKLSGVHRCIRFSVPPFSIPGGTLKLVSTYPTGTLKLEKDQLEVTSPSFRLPFRGYVETSFSVPGVR